MGGSYREQDDGAGRRRERYEEGDEIPIVYSQRTPRVSAAKHLYETMTKAVKEKQANNPGTV